jgi:hypothetical protein
MGKRRQKEGISESNTEDVTAKKIKNNNKFTRKNGKFNLPDFN